MGTVYGQQPGPSPMSLMGGMLASGIGAYAALSDARLKENIELVGKSPSNVNIYSFKYKGEDGKYEGVMAQEVSWASIMGDDGYLMVDYSKLDVEFRRLN